jgi:hypothetical protein
VVLGLGRRSGRAALTQSDVNRTPAETPLAKSAFCMDSSGQDQKAEPTQKASCEIPVDGKGHLAG